MLFRSELGIINLKWENPESNLIKKIKIVAGEDYEYISENIISEYTFENMPIKGYSISIYTIDKFGNLSVPQCVNAFPGSNNEL